MKDTVPPARYTRRQSSHLTPGNECGRQWLMCLIVLLLIWGELLLGVATAAERSRPFRIGVLTESWGATPQTVGLRDSLIAFGYRENVDFDIGVRFTQGNLAALPAAARQLVTYGVDLLFLSRESAALAAQRSSNTIPIVFAGVGNPVGLGLIETFARPGGNITGVSDLALELGPKRLEIFQELIPGLKRVLYIYDSRDTFSMSAAGIYRDAAKRLGIVLVERVVQTETEAQATLTQVPGKVDGILAPHQVSLNIGGFILDAGSQRGIPTMFNIPFFVENGGLASYGPSAYASGKQAARLVDKIMKGANPADIAVETNSDIEFVINLKTVEALGLTIAPEVLFQANKVIR